MVTRRYNLSPWLNVTLRGGFANDIEASAVSLEDALKISTIAPVRAGT
jgi:hypothetical protein